MCGELLCNICALFQTKAILPDSNKQFTLLKCTLEAV